MEKDMRLKVYHYYNQLMEHLNGDTSVFFNGEVVYPRQFEIHLPSNHKRSCDCHCKHCLLPNNTIITNNGEVFNISDVVEGSSLLGNMQVNKVKKITKHDYSGNAVIIKPAYLLPFEVTSNHELFVYENGDIIEKQAGLVKRGDYVVVPKPIYEINDSKYIDVFDYLKEYTFNYKRKEPDYLKHKACKLLKGHMSSNEVSEIIGFTDSYIRKIWNTDNIKEYSEIVYKVEKNIDEVFVARDKSIPLKRHIEINSDLAYILGLYVAEGSVFKAKDRPMSASIRFSLNQKETDLIQKIKNIFKSLFDREINVDNNKKTQGCNVEILQPSLIPYLFESLCGNGSVNKKIPDFIFKSYTNIQSSFLQGYLDGDGSTRGAYQRLSTVSFTLFNQLSQLLLSLGYMPCQTVRNREGKSYIQDRVVSIKYIYNIDFRVEPYLKKNLSKYIEYDTFYIVEVTDIENYHYSGNVYDITTDGNNSFTMPFILSHNCAGALFDKTLGTWEITGLELLNNLKGKIPYHIYGGAYTEPLLNPYYMTFLATTKKYGNHFGIHTNGVILNMLEESQGWLTELNRISTDDVDYLSISLDAGFPWSWGKTKGMKNVQLFNEIISAVKKACEIREKNGGRGHAIRLCYLISPDSGTRENFVSICNIAKELGVDSLRFSIPFGNYNQDFDKVREYKQNVELPMDIVYRGLLEDLVSQSKTEKPYIFYTGPEFTDIDEFTFGKCFYYLYQVTYGADGFAYKCSTSATPTAKQCRLGKITADIEEFEKVLLKNANPDWDCQKMCFSNNVRCNRMGMEINKKYYEDNQ